MENIHKRLKILRKKANLTQEDFGNILNISKATYSTLEIGTRPLKINEAFIIKKIFNISYDWLLDGDGDIKKFDEKTIKTINIIQKMNVKEIINYIKKEIIKTQKKEKIIKEILIKFYNEKEIFGFKYTNHSYRNRVHFILIEILKSINYNNNDEAKVSLFYAIKEFYKNEFFMQEVKNEIYLLLENITEDECRQLLVNKQITINLITQKINIFDRKINDFKIKDVIPLFISKRQHKIAL